MTFPPSINNYHEIGQSKFRTEALVQTTLFKKNNSYHLIRIFFYSQYQFFQGIGKLHSPTNFYILLN